MQMQDSECAFATDLRQLPFYIARVAALTNFRRRERNWAQAQQQLYNFSYGVIQVLVIAYNQQKQHSSWGILFHYGDGEYGHALLLLWYYVILCNTVY
eukprot:6204462-Pleurochrysis_carterae.AAC.2